MEIKITIKQVQQRIGSKQISEFNFPYFILESDLQGDEEAKKVVEKILGPINHVIESAKKDNEQTISRLKEYVNMLGSLPEDTQKIRDKEDEMDLPSKG